MSKAKEARLGIIIECKNCKDNSSKTRKGVSRYLTSKNRRTTTNKLELLKYCKFCNEHTHHKEIK